MTVVWPVGRLFVTLLLRCSISPFNQFVWRGKQRCNKIVMK